MTSADGFPNEFLWGVGSSAYQVEGASSERGENVWDNFCTRPGAIWGGTDGRAGADHVQRYREDVDLIARLGVGAYRFSIAWTRVLPTGAGKPSAAGLDFYDRLVDELLERGVEPWVTLFHWDFPLELYYRGGWLNRDNAERFGEYAALMARRLGKRVHNWITINEPQCFLGLGHHRGTHAPGLEMGRRDFLRAAHHALLAHGRAVAALRAELPDANVGWAPTAWVPYPASEDPVDIEAARRSMFAIGDDAETWPLNTSWYADPVCLGQYPEAGLRRFGQDLPRGFEADLGAISAPLDFFGINIYHGIPTRGTGEGLSLPAQRVPGHAETAMGWAVEPKSLYWGPRFLAERYHLPLYVTENGLANTDWIQADGRIRDAARVDFLSRYLQELRRAIADGVDVRGYFHWCLTDNFEWEFGYAKRFGLVYVDYATMARHPKDSFAWYRHVVTTNGADLAPRWSE